MHATTDLVGPVIEKPEVAESGSKLKSTKDMAAYWKQEYKQVVEDYNKLIAAIRDNDRTAIDTAMEIHDQCPYKWTVEDKG